MHVLIDARFYGLENTGFGRYLINLVDYLQKDTENKYTLLLRRKYFKKLKLPKNWQKVLAEIPHYSFEEQVKLPGIIRKQKPDLVHFPNFNVPVFWRGKFVVTIHDMTMHRRGIDASKLSPLVFFLKKVPYNVIFRRAVKKSAKIIVPSKSVKTEIGKYFNVGSKISVIYEGVPRAPVEGADNKRVLESYELADKNYIFYVGSTYPHKNLKKVFKALVYLNKPREEKLYFAIASSRNFFLKKLEKEARRVGAGEHVKFLGFVPDEKLFSLYKNSLAFVFASFSEGFGLPGLEAMRAGALVAASEIPVFKEVYGDSAFYFNPNDEKDIARALKKIINLSEGEKGRILAGYAKLFKRYSWEKMAKETSELYKRA